MSCILYITKKKRKEKGNIFEVPIAELQTGLNIFMF